MKNIIAVLVLCLVATSVEAKSFKSMLNSYLKESTVSTKSPSKKGYNAPAVQGSSKGGNHTISNFGEAKRLMKKDAGFYVETLYCGCKIDGKTKVDAQSCGYVPPTSKNGSVSSRAGKIEYEHVSSAHSFGQSFEEWRNPKGICGGKTTGRKCAEKNPEFARMESDLHNLWAEDGLTNLLRSNKTHQALTDSDYSFGKCDIKLTSSGFTARPEARGTVARTLKYMNDAYPNRGIISSKNEKLYDAWDKMYKATPMECAHHEAAARIQGNVNSFTVEACKAAGLKY